MALEQLLSTGMLRIFFSVVLGDSCLFAVKVAVLRWTVLYYYGVKGRFFGFLFVLRLRVEGNSVPFLDVDC